MRPVSGKRLPLGIDLGLARVRVAALSLAQDGTVKLDAIGAADVVESQATALASAVSQLGVNERRCIPMMRLPGARLRSVQLPPMKRRQADRAIRFEGISLFPAENREHIVVRSIDRRADDGGRRVLIAAASIRQIRETMAIAASAGLRPVCLDHEICALTRLGQLPILDIGFNQSTLIAVAEGVPVAHVIHLGGEHFTHALAADLGVDYSAAEARKRTVGLGGAATGAVDAFISALCEQTTVLRSARDAWNETLYICGNGSRLLELRERIAAEIMVNVVPISLRGKVATTLPLEVERSGAIDWFAAIAAAIPVSREPLVCTA